MESDYEVAGVPTTHREREQGEDALDAGELAAMRHQLKQHPQRQQRADGIADDLKDFERIEWGHFRFVLCALYLVLCFSAHQG